MATMTSKLPTNSRPIIQDPDLAAAIENILEPYNGKALEKAQAAVRKVATSNAQGPFAQVVAAYADAVSAAVERDKGA
jgi:FlaG/FlaF family flagellin (archaellin)